MIGILLITHNGLGDSLVDCVCHVLGDVPPNLKVLSVLATDDPQAKEDEGRETAGDSAYRTSHSARAAVTRSQFALHCCWHC